MNFVRDIETIIGIVLLSGLMLFPAFGQDQERFDRDEEEAREQLEEQRTKELEQTWTEQLRIKYGGWMRSSYYAIEDESAISVFPQNDRYLRELDNRIWGNFEYRKTHQVYGRFQFLHQNFSPGDQIVGSEDDNDLEIDQLFYSLDLDRALDLNNSSSPFQNLRLTAGRQYLKVGNGLVYSRDHDGLKLEGDVGDFEAQLFAARSDHDEFNIDKSVPGFEHSERYFKGGEVRYEGFPRGVPYVYGLFQRDSSPERPESSLEFDYDSQYAGAGFESEPYKNLSFSAEFVLERGESHAVDPITLAQTVEDIEANAFVASLTYFWRRHGLPEISLEYMRGSGDPDRLNVTDTVGGNNPGTDDTNFLYFGYINTGLSLNPRLSNLSIWHLEGGYQPFKSPDQKWTESFKELKLGIDLFLYRKLERTGGISDLRAINFDKDVGWETDFTADWRIFSDTLLQARYGVFFQGDAYADSGSSRNFFSVHLTVTY